jgi:hypothetical protein
MNKIGAISIDLMWIKSIVLNESIEGAMRRFLKNDGREDNFDEDLFLFI